METSPALLYYCQSVESGLDRQLFYNTGRKGYDQNRNYSIDQRRKPE